MGRTFLRWLPLVLVGLGLVVFFIVDNGVKAGEGVGFCPADAQWTLLFADTAAFWKELEQTPSFEAVREEWNPLGDLALGLRKATGIRPTPIRWQLWMGHSFLGAGGRHGTGGCVRPGLLPRIAHAMNRIFAQPDDGVYRYRQYYYAWRDGFLIFSTSPGYVAASLEAPPFEANPASDKSEFLWHWRDAPQNFLKVRAADGLPLDGWVDVAVTERREALELPPLDVSNPLLEVAATQCADVHELLTLLRRPLEAAKAAQLIPLPPLATPDLLARDESALQTTRQCALSLHISPVGEDSAPRYLLRLRPDVNPPDDTHPFGEVPGLYTKWIGSDWLVSDAPELVATDGAGDPSIAEADVVVRIAWAAFGQAAEARLMQVADQSPSEEEGMDLLRRHIPVARGLARAGALDLRGNMQDGRLAISGHLARR